MSSIWVVWNGTKHAAGESVCEAWGGNPATSQLLCRSLGGWCALTEAGGHAAGWTQLRGDASAEHEPGATWWGPACGHGVTYRPLPAMWSQARAPVLEQLHTSSPSLPSMHPMHPFRIGNTDQKQGRSCGAGSCVTGLSSVLPQDISGEAHNTWVQWSSAACELKGGTFQITVLL